MRRATALTPVGSIRLRTKRSTLADQVSERLVEAILARQVKPGQRLYIAQLAQRMGLSRTPVKEAMIRLASEGLVTFPVGGGVYLNHPTRRDLVELFDASLLCELHGVGRGLKVAPDSALTSLSLLAVAFEDIVETADEARYVECVRSNARFHAAIVGLSGNDRIVAWYETLARHLQFCQIVFAPDQKRRWAREAIDGHRAVVEACLARDAARAAAVLEAHAGHARDWLLAEAPS